MLAMGCFGCRRANGEGMGFTWATLRTVSFCFLSLSMALSVPVRGAVEDAGGSIIWWNPDRLRPNPNTGFSDVAISDNMWVALKVDGTLRSSATVPSPNSGFVAIAGGRFHALALRANGTVVSMGDCLWDVCGDGGGYSDYVAISAADQKSMGLRADGSIVVWGYDSYGTKQVPAPNSSFVAVAAGVEFCLGLKANGSIVAWGNNSCGQCNVPAPNADFVAIAAGANHSIGLKRNGSVVAWGWNQYHQCDVPVPNAGFVKIKAGYYGNLAQKADGTLVGWGMNVDSAGPIPAADTKIIGFAVGNPSGAIIVEPQFSRVLTGPTTTAGYSSAAAWCDFDRDGDDDLYLVRGRAGYANCLLVNDGLGNFTENTPAVIADLNAGTDANWGDYDNDGDADLFLTNADAPNRLFENIGPGAANWQFAEVFGGGIGYGGQSVDCEWVDFDHDGNLEIYVSNRDGDSQLLSAEDGFRDVLPASLRGVGAHQGIAWSDFNLDLLPDLFEVNEGTEHTLYRQLPGGAFSSEALVAPVGGQGCSVADFNNDGAMDIHVTYWGSGSRLLRNIGGGQFVEHPDPVYYTTDLTQGAAWGDSDNYGELNLFLANYGVPNRLLGYAGAQALDPLIQDSGNAIGASWDDIDNDGDLDLYVCNDGQADLLLRNNKHTTRKWLEVNLSGYRGPGAPLSTANAQGAIVMAIAGEDTMTRQVGGGTGYAGQASARLHFGLGSHSQVDKLVVYWPRVCPNGAHHLSVVRNIPANQILAVAEPEFGISDVPAGNGPEVQALLGNCVPNPFNGATAIEFELKVAGQVELSVFDLAGRLIARPLKSAFRDVGQHRELWDGRDESGRTVAAGTYLVRLRNGNRDESVPVVLVK